MRVQVVIAGTLRAEDTEQLLNSAYSVFAPDRVVVTIDLGNEATVNFWEGFNPELLAMVKAVNLRDGSRCWNKILFKDLRTCLTTVFLYPDWCGGFLVKL